MAIHGWCNYFTTAHFASPKNRLVLLRSFSWIHQWARDGHLLSIMTPTQRVRTGGVSAVQAVSHIVCCFGWEKHFKTMGIYNYTEI